MVLSLSMLFSSIAMLQHYTFWGTCVWTDRCHAVCFVECVLDVLRGREHSNVWRQQFSVMSTSDARQCHLKVLWVFSDVAEARFFC